MLLRRVPRSKSLCRSLALSRSVISVARWFARFSARLDEPKRGFCTCRRRPPSRGPHADTVDSLLRAARSAPASTGRPRRASEESVVARAAAVRPVEKNRSPSSTTCRSTCRILRRPGRANVPTAPTVRRYQTGTSSVGVSAHALVELEGSRAPLVRFVPRATRVLSRGVQQQAAGSHGKRRDG